MGEFEELFEKLLQAHPELTKDTLTAQIKAKKDKIGSGYLTDQGALFLISADLGVELAEPLKVEMGLKDLYIGAKEISLETRVLNMSQPKQFNRKDGTPFFLRTMTVYDGDATVSVKLWDEKANLETVKSLKPGDLIKILKAYVKSDLNGAPSVNVGSGSTIESSTADSSIPSIDAITMDVSLVKPEMKDLAVSGIIDGTIGTINFTNKQGNPGMGLKLQLKGADGNVTKVVVWGQDESGLPKVIAPGAKVKLLGVKPKAGQFGLEIHGNDATIVQVEGKSEIEPVTTRILSIAKNDSGKAMILGVDKSKTIYHIVDSSGMTGQYSMGDVIECMPSQIFGKSVTIDSDSFVRKLDDDNSIVPADSMKTKIKDIAPGEDISIDAIVIKAEGTREIQTKNGDNVTLADILVEDDSGQIKVTAWRNIASLLAKCSLGEIITITGATAKNGYQDQMELTLTAFSSVTKKN